MSPPAPLSLLPLILLCHFLIKALVVHAVLFDGQLSKQPLYCCLVLVHEALSHGIRVDPLHLITYAGRQKAGRRKKKEKQVSIYHMPLTTLVLNVHMTRTPVALRRKAPAEELVITSDSSGRIWQAGAGQSRLKEAEFLADKLEAIVARLGR